MKNIPRAFIILSGIFLALMPFAETSGQTKEPEPPPVSIWQARRLVSQDYATVILQNRRQVKIDRSTFRLSTDAIDFDVADVKNGTRQHFTVDLKNLPSLSLHCATDKGKLGSEFWNCVPSTAEGKPLPEGLHMLWEGGGYTDYCISLKAYQSAPDCTSSLLYNAKLFGSALYRLHQYSWILRLLCATSRSRLRRGARWPPNRLCRRKRACNASWPRRPSRTRSRNSLSPITKGTGGGAHLAGGMVQRRTYRRRLWPTPTPSTTCSLIWICPMRPMRRPCATRSPSGSTKLGIRRCSRDAE